MNRTKAPAHSAEFRRRRTINWLTLGLTYSAMYMGRYNLSFANKSLTDAYGWDTGEIGTIISAGLSVYGLSAIFNGPIADKIGGRRAMLIGAYGTVVFNLLFAAGAWMGFLGTGPLLIGYFSVVWAFNAYFQSFSALALIKVNASWFHIAERGVFSGIFGSMIQIGRWAIYTVGPIVVAVHGWWGVFFAAAAGVAVMAVFATRYVRNTPEDCALPALDVQDASSGDTAPVTVGYVLRKILFNRVTLAIAAAEFCTGFIRHGFEQWFPRYMQEGLGLNLQSAVFKKGSTAVVVAGILGALAAGTLSDWIFKGRRAPMACLGYLLSIGSLAVVWRAPSDALIVAAFVVNSFGISVVHSMLSGTASMDFGGKRAAGTAAGIFDGMQYVGGAFTGLGLGYLVKSVGWGYWAPAMIGFAVIGAVIMMFLWNARPARSGAH
jgi:MFS transporter, OPA family, glycerol-3-phosphate transporter